MTVSFKEIIEEMDSVKLIYDLKSLPEGLSVDQLYNIIKGSGIVVWDSYNKGEEPKIINCNDLTIEDVGFISKEQFDEKFNNIKD